ncbi:MAG: hypothetical protein HN759_01405 [Akkermansiaceae bacterium]|nr:hypothetical protein [Akkermansiaceae bacterium]
MTTVDVILNRGFLKNNGIAEGFHRKKKLIQCFPRYLYSRISSKDRSISKAGAS